MVQVSQMLFKGYTDMLWQQQWKLGFMIKFVVRYRFCWYSMFLASEFVTRCQRFMATVQGEYSMSVNGAKNLKTVQWSFATLIAPDTLANQEEMWMQQHMEEPILENHWVTYEVTDFTIMRMWKWLCMVENAVAWFILCRIFKLMPRSDKCIIVVRDCIDKWWYVSRIN